MTAKLTATLAMAAILVAAALGQDDHRRHTTTTNRTTHSQTHTYRTHGPQRGDNHSRTNSTRVQTYQQSHTDRKWNDDRTVQHDRTFNSQSRFDNNRASFQNNRTEFQHRPNRFYGGRQAGGGEHFRPMDWRRDHPGWNGHLYYHTGRYYFDPGFTIVADIDNEWSAIAAISGGAAILGALDNDPYLVFAGEDGEVYALTLYNADLYSSDPVLRLRAEFFSRPYFWRDGVRYDRHIVEHGGHRFYQFQRH